MPFELCADDEPVEAVVLRLAAPDADESLLKFLLDRAKIILHAGGRKAEIANANRRLSAQGLHFVGNFRLHFEAHVLEPRHDLRQRYGRPGVDDLEVELALLLTAMAIEVG